MHTDTEIKSQGMKVLIKNLGMVEAEKFVALIQESLLIIQNGKEIYGKERQLQKLANLQWILEIKKAKHLNLKKEKLLNATTIVILFPQVRGLTHTLGVEIELKWDTVET
jgi:precorrin-6B methylase 1